MNPYDFPDDWILRERMAIMARSPRSHALITTVTACRLAPTLASCGVPEATCRCGRQATVITPAGPGCGGCE